MCEGISFAKLNLDSKLIAFQNQIRKGVNSYEAEDRALPPL